MVPWETPHRKLNVCGAHRSEGTADAVMRHSVAGSRSGGNENCSHLEKVKKLFLRQTRADGRTRPWQADDGSAALRVVGLGSFVTLAVLTIGPRRPAECVDSSMASWMDMAT